MPWIDLSEGIKDADFLDRHFPTLARYCPYAFDCALARRDHRAGNSERWWAEQEINEVSRAMQAP